MKKKILSLFMAILMFALMVPVQAFADETLKGDTDKNGTVDVNLTISEGETGFYMTRTDKIIFYETLNVPYFDLALYGMERFYYNPDCYTGAQQEEGTAETANGIVTAMHVLIYATEIYMCGYSEEEAGKGKGKEAIFEYIHWNGQGAGSSFVDSFWNGSYNLNYYLDYEYPLGASGWGSTSDQQALHDGSKINIHLIEDQMVQGSSYSFFETEDKTRDFLEINEGESETLTLYKTLSDYNNTGKLFEVIPEADVYYMAKEDYIGQTVGEEGWTELGTTDENGKIVIPGSLTAGEYYISCEGALETNERGPAAFVLNIKTNKPEVVYGDVNGDENINAIDATLVLQKFAKMDVEIDSEAADVNGDGNINAIDATLILQKFAKIITKFPVETNE